MIGRDGGHHLRAHAHFVDRSARAADARFGRQVQQRRHGEASHEKEDVGLQNLELTAQEHRASRDFVGLGIAVSGRTALEDVQNRHVLAPFDTEDVEHRGEKLAALSHKRNPLKVFFAARRFADDHEARFSPFFGKDHVLSGGPHGTDAAGVGKAPQRFPVGRPGGERRLFGHRNDRNDGFPGAGYVPPRGALRRRPRAGCTVRDGSSRRRDAGCGDFRRNRRSVGTNGRTAHGSGRETLFRHLVQERIFGVAQQPLRTDPHRLPNPASRGVEHQSSFQRLVMRSASSRRPS